ncbi:MAG: tRNA threonylcarbamoyladenosine dehydratase, partial [Leptothrix sp. (in: b-proteobacteria)]
RTLAQPDAPGRAKGPRDLGVSCVFSREPIALPDQACEVQGGLHCGGYGSSVMVTAAFGMAAAEQALKQVRV